MADLDQKFIIKLVEINIPSPIVIKQNHQEISGLCFSILKCL